MESDVSAFINKKKKKKKSLIKQLKIEERERVGMIKTVLEISFYFGGH